MTTVAVLGTGIMGRPMAANMLTAGLTVHAWNRTIEKAQPLAERGATVFAAPAEAVAGADIVVTMLADGQAVQDGFDAVSVVFSPDAVWIQMSTVGVEWSGKLPARGQSPGIGFRHAPVLGTKQPAE